MHLCVCASIHRVSVFCGFVLLNTAIVLYDQHNENQFIKKYLIETVVPHVLLLLFVTYKLQVSQY